MCEFRADRYIVIETLEEWAERATGEFTYQVAEDGSLKEEKRIYLEIDDKKKLVHDSWGGRLTEVPSFFPCCVWVPDSKNDTVSIHSIGQMQTDIISGIMAGFATLWNIGGEEAALEAIIDIEAAGLFPKSDESE